MFYIKSYKQISEDKFEIHTSERIYFCRCVDNFLDFTSDNPRWTYNDILFEKTGIDKKVLFYKCFNRHYTSGDWPYCKNLEECLMLLEALIKESKLNIVKNEI